MAKFNTYQTQQTENSTDALIADAVAHLKAGRLVAIPTETVYGLGADACNEDAVKNIYRAKGRPSFNPLICHVSSPEMAARYAQVSSTAQRLMQAFWPGPLTLVLPLKASSGLAPSVTSGLMSVGLRCPNNDLTRAIIHALGRPVAAPSANPSGKLSPTQAAHVAETLGSKVAMIVDGGPADAGIESTIVRLSNEADSASPQAEILRPGTITQHTLEAFLEAPVHLYEGDNIIAPGQLASHYAPNSRVRLNVTQPGPDDIYIGFGPESAPAHFNLSESADLVEAARALFDLLRRADALAATTGGTSARSIAVAPIPTDGIGMALNDRLARAAAPR